MGTVRIEQYSGQSLDHKQTMQMPQLNVMAAALTLTSGGASVASAVLAPGTRALFIRSSGSRVALRIGDSTTADPVAVTGDASVLDTEGRWFGIDPTIAGKPLKVAVIDY